MSEELKCEKCGSKDVDSHIVDEVDGVAVGPYTVFLCDFCGWEWYEH